MCVCACVHVKRISLVQYTGINLRPRCGLDLKEVSMEGLPRVLVTNKGTWNPGRRVIKFQVRCCAVGVLVATGNVKGSHSLSESVETFSCCIYLYSALRYNHIL